MHRAASVANGALTSHRVPMAFRSWHHPTPHPLSMQTLSTKVCKVPRPHRAGTAMSRVVAARATVMAVIAANVHHAKKAMQQRWLSP